MTTMSRIVNGPDTVSTDGVTSVRVQLVGGALEVVPRAEPGVMVEVTAVSGQPLEIATEGDRLSVGYPSIGWDGWLKRLTTTDSPDEASVRLHVGAGTSVSAATVSAPIQLAGSTGDVDISTASATIRLSRTVGGVRIRTASGDVGIEDHDGPVVVSGASGAIRVDGNLPKANLTSVAGPVEVRHRGASALLAITTVSGPVDIRVPAATQLELEVRGVAARVKVDGRDQSAGFGVTRVAEAGGGDRVVATVTTVTGNVAVERANPWPLPPSDIEDAPQDTERGP